MAIYFVDIPLLLMQEVDMSILSAEGNNFASYKGCHNMARQEQDLGVI